MSMNYKNSGEYLIPDLKLRETETKKLGKYGRMRKTYLREHRPVLWNKMILSETLYPHLREIDETANTRLSQMVETMAKTMGITESLKESDPMQWTAHMNNLKAQAEETILSELVFS